MNEDWYYGIGDDTIGPMSFEALLSVLRRRSGWGEVQVWCADFDDWRAAKDVRQIAFALGAGARNGMPESIAAQARPAWREPEAPHDARRKRLLLIGGGAAALIVAAGAAFLVSRPFISPLERAVTRIVGETKPALPKKADESTSLVDVAASGTRLVFQHVWDGPRFAIPANLGALMKARKLSDICAAMKEVLDLGGTVEYSYRSQSALFIASFEVKKEDCT